MTITNVAAGLFSLVMYHFKYTKELKEKKSNTNEVGV
jgi:hypothetical protein